MDNRGSSEEAVMNDEVVIDALAIIGGIGVLIVLTLGFVAMWICRPRPHPVHIYYPPDPPTYAEWTAQEQQAKCCNQTSLGAENK